MSDKSDWDDFLNAEQNAASATANATIAANYWHALIANDVPESAASAITTGYINSLMLLGHAINQQKGSA